MDAMLTSVAARESKQRGDNHAMYKHILLPTDGSELSTNAAKHGIDLAKCINAKVTALVVTTPFHSLVVDPIVITNSADQYRRLVAAQTAKYLDVVRDAAAAVGVACDLVRIEHDQPYEAIIDAANKNGCDLIVMASHGLRGVSAIVIGSETLKVLTHTNIPVLVYR
jgi:nucleotide-binding universal stress UspA family protein